MLLFKTYYDSLSYIIAFLFNELERAQVTLSLFTDFENFTKFKPALFQENSANAMLAEVIAWGGAFKTLRTDNRQESTMIIIKL